MEEAHDGVGGGWALGMQKFLGPQVGGWLSACPQGRGTCVGGGVLGAPFHDSVPWGR